MLPSIIAAANTESEVMHVMSSSSKLGEKRGTYNKYNTQEAKVARCAIKNANCLTLDR